MFPTKAICILSISISLVNAGTAIIRTVDGLKYKDTIMEDSVNITCSANQTALYNTAGKRVECMNDADVMKDINIPATSTSYTKRIDSIWIGVVVMQCKINSVKFKSYGVKSWGDTGDLNKCFQFVKNSANQILTLTDDCMYRNYTGKLLHAIISCGLVGRNQTVRKIYNRFFTLPSSYKTTSTTPSIIKITTTKQTIKEATTKLLISTSNIVTIDNTSPSLSKDPDTRKINGMTSPMTSILDQNTTGDTYLKNSSTMLPMTLNMNGQITSNGTFLHPMFSKITTPRQKTNTGVKQGSESSSKIVLFATLAASLVFVVLVGFLVYLFCCRKRRTTRKDQDLLITMAPLDDDVFSPRNDVSALYAVPKKKKKSRIFKPFKSVKKEDNEWSGYDEVGALIEGVYEVKESTSEDIDERRAITIDGYDQVDMRLNPPTLIQDDPYEFIGSRTNSFNPGSKKDVLNNTTKNKVEDVESSTPEEKETIPLKREESSSLRAIDNSPKVSTFKPGNSIRMKQQRTSMRREKTKNKEIGILMSSTHEDVTITPPVSKRSSPDLLHNKRLGHEEKSIVDDEEKRMVDDEEKSIVDTSDVKNHSYEKIPEDENINDSQLSHPYSEIKSENDDNQYESIWVDDASKISEKPSTKEGVTSSVPPIGYADVDIVSRNESKTLKKSNAKPNYVDVQVVD